MTAMGFQALMLFLIFCIIVFLPVIIAGFVWADNKKVYRVVWRYDRLCYPSTTLVKAKSPYDAWHKVEKQHAISIELIDITEYV